MHRTYKIDGPKIQYVDTWTERDIDAAVITTFNADGPFMRDVLREVAADVLATARSEGRIASRWSYDDDR